MGRRHIHLATGLPGDDGVISGMRRSSEVHVFVSVVQAAAEGVVFYRSKNNVILTAGVEDSGVLPLRFIVRAVDSITKLELLLAHVPVAAAPAVPVGMAPVQLSKSQQKNAKKKAKAQEEKGATAPAPAPAKAQAKAQAVAITEPVSRLDLERKIRNVKKTLDQIDRLVERQEGGEVLEQSQVAKIETRSDIEAELAELEEQL